MSKLTKRVPARNFKVWRGLVSQTGTAAPTAQVLENTLGGDIVWTRNSAGNYTGTLSNAFPAGKVSFNYGILEASGQNYRLSRNDNNSVLLWTKSTLGGAFADALLFGQTLEIYVQL